MKTIILYFMVLFLFSCKEKCKVNNNLKEDFYQAMDIINQSEVKGQDVKVSDKRNAIFFLSELTGHKSQIEDIEHAIYLNNNTYIKDVEIWEKWYDKNKCMKYPPSVSKSFNK